MLILDSDDGVLALVMVEFDTEDSDIVDSEFVDSEKLESDCEVPVLSELVEVEVKDVSVTVDSDLDDSDTVESD